MPILLLLDDLFSSAAKNNNFFRASLAVAYTFGCDVSSIYQRNIFTQAVTGNGLRIFLRKSAPINKLLKSQIKVVGAQGIAPS
jgi:hypothetical protein